MCVLWKASVITKTGFFSVSLFDSLLLALEGSRLQDENVGGHQIQEGKAKTTQ